MLLFFESFKHVLCPSKRSLFELTVFSGMTIKNSLSNGVLTLYFNGLAFVSLRYSFKVRYTSLIITNFIANYYCITSVLLHGHGVNSLITRYFNGSPVNGLFIITSYCRFPESTTYHSIILAYILVLDKVFLMLHVILTFILWLKLL